MVEQVVTLDKWYGGMTSDEYLGGHFYYGENVDVRTNTKAFKLSNRLVENIINYRGNGSHKKLISSKWEVLGFSSDGYIEGTLLHKETATGTSTRGGYLYNRDASGYFNAISFDNYIVGVTSTELDAFEIDVDQGYGLGLWGDNEIITPNLTSNTGWTVGAGWTTGSGGAVHTPGNTEDLEQTITPGAGTGTIRVYIKNWTAGELTIWYDGSIIDTLSIETGKPSERRYTYNVTTSASDLVELRPTTDFNGTVSYVKVYKYDATKIDANISLGTATVRPLLYDGGILYIGSGNKIETIDTTLNFGSWVVDDGLLLQKGDNIVGITKIGNIINIYTTNGSDGIKYMWNGVDEAPNEKTIWKNKPFLSVDGDGNQDYVICGYTDRRYFYTTVGYEKQLISQSKYMPNYDASGAKNAYILENRLDTKDILGFFGDTIWLGCYGGVYTYGTYNPGLAPSIVKEFATNDYINIYRALSMAIYMSAPYISYEYQNKNIISRVEPTQYCKQGYILTSPIIGETLSQEKNINKMRLGYLLPSSLSSIKIYAMVNDKHYYRFYVNGVTTKPVVGDVYTSVSNNRFTVVDEDIDEVLGSGYLTCEATIPTDGIVASEFYLTKISGIGQTTIDYTDFDNYCLIKTITTDKYKYGNDYIFGNSFIDAHMPYIHKLQLKIELLSTDNNFTPEVYDIITLQDNVKDGL